MKIRISLIVVLCVLIAAGHVHAASAADSVQPIIIWHIPHPDDETLAMAGSIYAASLAGHRNIVVLYTGGESSVVRLGLNLRLYSPSHRYGSDQTGHGHVYLSAADFARARLNEARAALAVLGVADEDIIEVHLPDGAIAPREVADLMRELHRRYPHAAHRTTSIYDQHADHRNLARALLLLQDEVEAAGLELDVGFYRVYIYDRPTDKRTLTNVEAVPVAYPEVKRRALAEFGVWDPARGRFAIGMRSVPRLFEAAAADPYEYVDVLSSEGIPAILRIGDIGAILFNDGVGVAYRTDPRWQWRIETPLKTFAPTLSLARNTPPQAYGVRLYAGVGVTAAGTLPQLSWYGGLDLLQRLLVEYTTHPHVGTWRIGYHFLY